ncbi:hypothetical protein [Streptosporangium sp. NPDC051022]|uniref:hypothetical protein n=1 Tax=Streptosporangium sp. NPDC051022 TaxID=3155752 RepID=UPI0034424E4D
MSADSPAQPPVAAGRARPWRLQSQGYVAFFGGCVAVTTIALINAARLGMPVKGRVLIACTGLAGLTLTLTLAMVLNPEVSIAAYTWLARGSAVVVHLVQAGVQKPYDRGTLLLSRGEEHAPMWLPGALAVLSGGLLEQAALITLEE